LKNTEDTEQKIFWRETLTKQSHATELSLMSDKKKTVASGRQNIIWSRQHSSNSGSVCPINENISRLRIQKAHQVSKDPTQLSSFWPYSWKWSNCWWQNLHTFNSEDACSFTFSHGFKGAVHFPW
jgi:hypothetical protein